MHELRALFALQSLDQRRIERDLSEQSGGERQSGALPDVLTESAVSAGRFGGQVSVRMPSTQRNDEEATQFRTADRLSAEAPDPDRQFDCTADSGTPEAIQRVLLVHRYR